MIILYSLARQWTDGWCVDAGEAAVAVLMWYGWKV